MCKQEQTYSMSVFKKHTKVTKTDVLLFYSNLIKLKHGETSNMSIVITE